MDKETLSNYGWIVILVLILAVMLALASPFGTFVAGAIKSTTAGLFSVNQAALGSAGIDVNDMVFENCDHLETEIRNATDTYTGDTCCKACGTVLQAGQTVRAKVPEGGKYTATDGTVYNPGDEMPEVVTNGDQYEYNYYRYTFKAEQDGWHVVFIRANTHSGPAVVGQVLSAINGKPLTDMSQTYAYVYYDFKFPDDYKVPETVTKMKAIFYCSDLTVLPDSFVIPNGVEDLEEAFSCTNLTNVPVIPEGVTNMKKTFKSSPNLKTYIGSADPDGDFSNYKLPSTVQSLYSAFETCSSITKAPAIPSGATDVQNMFSACRSLVDINKVVIPSGARGLYGMFKYCSALEDASCLVVPSNIITANDMVEGCTSLKKLPDMSQMSASSMYGMFKGCTSLTDISDFVIPECVTDMCYTFANCTSLTNGPTIPSNVNNIRHLFSGCTSLTTAPELSAKIAYLEGAFANCTSLTGEIIVNSSYISGSDTCFANVDFDAQNLTLTGTCTDNKLDILGATGTNYCADCNGKCNGGH